MRIRTFAIGLLALFLAGCGGLSKLDYARIGSRGTWQLPERVIESLEIAPGDRVADLGAGDGYFLSYLVDAVGASGHIYAVDVEPDIVRELERRVAEGGYHNATALLGQTDDPGLPAGGVDLVLLVNTYHHIEDRPAYFERLRADLAPSGRVAVIDPNAATRGILRLFLDEGHMSRKGDVAEEMHRAGYHRQRGFDFLPTQIFEVFAPEAPTR
jgi:ubiquinone/menaquinone biosynthesis C-methylase UbiE